MYKIGDRIKNIKTDSPNYTREGKVIEAGGGVRVRYDNGSEGFERKNPERYYKIITGASNNKSTGQIMADVMNSFVMAFLSEPEKSYRKAGITNGDGILTDTGMKIFLTWLLTKNPEFKAQVVDGLLADMKEEKGCK